MCQALKCIFWVVLEELTLIMTSFTGQHSSILRVDSKSDHQSCPSHCHFPRALGSEKVQVERYVAILAPHLHSIHQE